MPGKDPSHWLLRLSPAEWLAAAATEMESARAALARRSHRPAVTHLRRAAGMACNALLCQAERPHWGRSYMEHVTALGADPDVPADVQAAARRLRETPAAAPALISLGRPGQLPDDATDLLRAAGTIIDWIAAEVSSSETGT